MGGISSPGKHQYTADVEAAGDATRSDFAAGAVQRASLCRSNASAAKGMAGVTVVEDGSFVGVVAPTDVGGIERAGGTEGRMECAAADFVEDAVLGFAANSHWWRPGRRRTGGTETGSVGEGDGRGRQEAGADLTVAYIAHAPLEPRAAVAAWTADKLTVWTGTQRPFGVRSELAQSFHIPERNIRVIMPGHGLRIRREAHGRGGHRGGTPGESRGQAGEARVDARRGIYLGIFPAGRRDRRAQRDR